MAIILAAVLWLAPPATAKDLVIKEPPKSMEKLYPPVSKENKWVQQMRKVNIHFGGVFLDMKEQDWENAEKHAVEFVDAYKEAADMVPEWKDYFDHDAAKKFAAAVKTRDPKQIGEASSPVGKTCGNCHDDQYISVWARYRWPSVDKIKITDPIEDKELGYGKYMHLLSSSIKGVTVNFGEGQYDRALKALPIFQKRFMELKSTCAKCHTNDKVKLFFVGEDAVAAFAGMKTELEKEKPNPAEFWKHVGLLGETGCTQCHLTHRAFTIIQDYWEKKDR
jgi:cytochrome c556